MTNEELNIAIAKAKGYDLDPKAEHDWEKWEDGSVNIFALESEYHNGPSCKRCGWSFCHHCQPDGYTMQLPCIPLIPDWSTNLLEVWKLEDEIPEMEKPVYASILRELVDHDYLKSKHAGYNWMTWYYIHATPRQRCEAWLAWKEGQK